MPAYMYAETMRLLTKASMLKCHQEGPLMEKRISPVSSVVCRDWQVW